MTLKIGILASTRASDLQPICDAIKARRLQDVEITILISNKSGAQALERARHNDIPSAVVTPVADEPRESYDQRVSAILDQHGVELILLIGYMRFLSPCFVKRYWGRVINVHPSLLPAFGGGMDKNVHQEVLDSGVKVTGCTLHFVDEGADSGPIICQKCVAVAEDETVDSLKAKVQKVEGEGFIEVIRLFQEGRLTIDGRKVRIG